MNATPEVYQSTPASLFYNLRVEFAMMLALTVGLVALSFYHYLLFHVVAEFFAVGIAIIMFVVAWHTYRFSRNHFLMYLGCGYFWIAWLDVAHTLLYFGMPTALDQGNFTSQFWITTRALEALLLLSAPLFLERRFSRGLALGGFGLVAALVASLILSGNFPATFVEGSGLTPFKVNSEYVICLLLVAAMLHLRRYREHIEDRMYRLMMVCIGLTIGAELAFTFYVHMYSLSNLIGHIFKLFSFWLIYVAIIRTTLAEPFAVMARGSSTYNAVPNPTLLVGRDGVIHQVNRAACGETGLREAELLGQPCHPWFHPAHLNPAECPLCQALTQGHAVAPLELELGRAGGWRQFTVTPVLDEAYGGASVQVSIDITLRKQSELALLRSNAELRQYAEVAAHQLQEPLRLISSYTQLLARRYRGQLDADADEFIGYTVNGAERMQGLLRDLLTYSEVGLQATPPVNVDAGQSLRHAREQLEEAIVASGARVDSAPLPVVLARPKELEQVFYQLLRNAIDNAGDTPPRIEIGARRETDGTWCVWLRDHGVGIAPRHQALIFKLFYRLQGPADKTSTGIGLALCKKIIEHYGGRIWVESEERQGACFYFTLMAGTGI